MEGKDLHGKIDDNTILHGYILASFLIVKNIMSSATEAEIGSLYENPKIDTVLQLALDYMVQPTSRQTIPHPRAS